MDITINPSPVYGTTQVPASKSMAQRALAAALLRKGKTVLQQFGSSEDELAALNIIQQLGASVIQEENNTIVYSSGEIIVEDNAVINCGESGLAARMFLPIMALNKKKKTITGTGTLFQRPFDVYENILPQLGISIKTNNGNLPIAIEGALQAQNINIDSSLSSQFLTGLLFAYSAANITEPVCIEAKNLNSKPYIDLTLQTIKDGGLNVPENKNYNKFNFNPQAHSTNTDVAISIEKDWSSASFLMVAAAISGQVTLLDLNIESLQADRKIIEVLEQCGANIQCENNTIVISKSQYNAFVFDATDCPDLIPPLVVLAAYCKGQSRIDGIQRLIHKESNRIESLKHLMTRLNIPFVCGDNYFLITGQEAISGGTVDSYKDHRIAMAAAITALRAKENVTVTNASAVNKSFPDFWKVLKQISTQTHY